MFKSSSEVHRFRAATASGDPLPPPQEGWQIRSTAGLGKSAFSDLPNAANDVLRTGFVLASDLSLWDFSDSTSCCVDRFVVFSLRIDQKKIPKQLFDADLRRRVSAWCEERGAERAPSAVRTQIRDALRDEWLSRVIPRVRIIPVVFCVDTGIVLAFGSLSADLSDCLRKLFFRSFGYKLVPADPVSEFGEDTSDRISQIRPLRIPELPLGLSGRSSVLGSQFLDEFYLWIWERHEQGSEIEVEIEGARSRVRLELQDRIQLSSESGDHASFRGSELRSDAREAVRVGKMPTQVSFSITDPGDVVYGYGLGSDYFCPKITFPTMSPEDGSFEADVFCRVHSTLSALSILDALLLEFLRIREQEPALFGSSILEMFRDEDAFDPGGLDPDDDSLLAFSAGPAS